MLRRACSIAFCTATGTSFALPLPMPTRPSPPPTAVTDDRQRGEAEDAPALHHLGDAVDRDHLLAQAVSAVILLLRLPRVGSLLCHLEPLLRTSGRPRGPRRPAPSRGHGIGIPHGRMRLTRSRALSRARRCACRSPLRRPCCRRSSRPCARPPRASTRSRAP